MKKKKKLSRRVKIGVSISAVCVLLASAPFFYFLSQDPPSQIWSKLFRFSRPACSDFHSLVCSQTGSGSADPTGSVRDDLEAEASARVIFSELIHSHPDWPAEKRSEFLVEAIYTPVRRQEITETFQAVRKAMLRLIKKQPKTVLTRAQKRMLTDRLGKTQLQLPPPAGLYSDDPELLTQNEVYYRRTREKNRDERVLRVGGAYLFAAKSRFNRVFTLAHELAHSIDPCEIKSAGSKLPAYVKLSRCLIEQGLVATPDTRTECGRDDQLSEAFADWMAVQVLAEALQTRKSQHYSDDQILKSAANSIRDLCERPGLLEYDSEHHPPSRVRIERIFGENPAIRARLGCPNTPQSQAYCKFE